VSTGEAAGASGSGARSRTASAARSGDEGIRLHSVREPVETRVAMGPASERARRALGIEGVDVFVRLSNGTLLVGHLEGCLEWYQIAG